MRAADSCSRPSSCDGDKASTSSPVAGASPPTTEVTLPRTNPDSPASGLETRAPGQPRSPAKTRVPVSARRVRWRRRQPAQRGVAQASWDTLSPAGGKRDLGPATRARSTPSWTASGPLSGPIHSDKTLNLGYGSHFEGSAIASALRDDMERYIQEHGEPIRGVGAAADQAEPATESVTQPAGHQQVGQDVVVLEAHGRPLTLERPNVPRSDLLDADREAETDATRDMVGVVEVELGIHEKYRALRQTEAALRTLSQRDRLGATSHQDGLPEGRRRHRRPRKLETPYLRVASLRHRDLPYATDELIMQRFRDSLLRRRR